MFKKLRKKFKQLICVHQYADIGTYFTNGKIEDAHFQRCVFCGKTK